MKLLLITGSLAEKTVKKFTKESAVEIVIIALKVPVAALLTVKQINQVLRKTDVQEFDMILVPGLVRGDTATISDSIGVPTFKGPKYAADLPTVLSSLDHVELSTTIPACVILQKELQQKALQELETVEKNRDILLKNPGNMLIGKLAIGKDFPMRVMAEIVDAALMPNDEIQRLAKQFVKNGANIIDVGMVAGGSRPLDAKRAVEAIKKVVDVPVSIDTLDPDEIKEAVSAGADLILSVDAGNVEEVASFASETAIVIIPTNQRKGYFPKKIEDRISFLEEIITKAKTLGMKKIIGDLILEPINILESLISFQKFSMRHPNIPIFVGVSNVTELIDADSIGVNALLARLSSEVNASIILATEKSSKANGTVREEVIASKMMFLAKKRESVPKDLGIDLLVLKDKRKHEEFYDKKVESMSHVVQTNEFSEKVPLDSHGEFRILLDRNSGVIVALHFSKYKALYPSNIVKGKTAKSVYTKIIHLGLITRLDHSAYLGSELAKAEVALKTGKEYIQDNVLFKEL
ncbi:dihydropteroate synthase-like protein [Candidatus Bathyarchaeota archaeon]|nr:dihydropteroate synthase-like protein [Candidatus Bathyarchaeota archaeon]